MPERETSLRDVLLEGLERKLYTAASLIVGLDGTVLEEHHIGREDDGGLQISPFHLFDLASLTKPIAVASLFIKEVQDGNLSLEDRLEKFLPKKWIGSSFQGTTLDLILSHRAGFPAYSNFFERLVEVNPSCRKEELVKQILSCTRETVPLYSDLGYILLGYVLETIHNRPLNQLFDALRKYFENQHLFFLPLEMPQDPMSPPLHLASLPHPVVSTGWCEWRKRVLKAEVHDCNSFCLGGVSGHAGIFGTSRAVFSWVSQLWKAFNNRADGTYHGWCSGKVVTEFFEKPDDTSSWVRGFDTPTPGNSTVAPYFSMKSIGHYGFTGTSFWLDLEDGFTVVLLTNRVYYKTDQRAFRDFRCLVHSTARLKLTRLS